MSNRHLHIHQVSAPLPAPQQPTRNIPSDDKDAEAAFADPDPQVRESDLKQRQVFKGWAVFWLAYQATGIIFGEIATSPLYVFSSTFDAPPSHQDLLGAVSLIIWSLTLIVTVKYIFVVLRADDEGEGGTFAAFSLLSRYSDIMKRDPRRLSLVKTKRSPPEDLHRSTQGFRAWLEKSKIAHGILKLLAVVGISLILADGVLTPAISVLGAMQGLQVADERVSNPTIIGTSCAVIVLLFLAQPWGVHRVSVFFTPVIITWLLFNGSFGIYNLVRHNHMVLKAFSPYYAGAWFMRNKTAGWEKLGGILLCFTGVECMFADMGAFSRRAIQISWLCLAYPCLLLTYLGQAAYMADSPDVYPDPFFSTVPPGMFWPSLILAIMAAIVASQATITACFQLLAQLMNASYFPQIPTKYTSRTHHGQVYIPLLNWLLMIGCVIVVAVYNDTTRLGHAYGVCLVLVTFITTNLVALVAIIVWRIHPLLVFVIWLPFITLDGLFLSASLIKVPDGAWFTIMLAASLAIFFVLWRYGKEKQWTSEAKEQNELSSLVSRSAATGNQALTEKYGGADLTQIDGLAIFLDKTGHSTPKVYEQWLCKFRAQMDVTVLMHMRALAVPHVPEPERFEVTKTSVKNVYRVILRHGYDDHVFTPDLTELIYDEVHRAIIRGVVMPSGDGEEEEEDDDDDDDDDDIASGVPPEKKVFPSDAMVAARLDRLEDAFAAQTLFLVGKQQLRICPEYHFVKRWALSAYLWIREISRNKTEKLNVPVDKLVEVGFVGKI